VWQLAGRGLEWKCVAFDAEGIVDYGTGMSRRHVQARSWLGGDES
jgi:hypothetical protein